MRAVMVDADEVRLRVIIVANRHLAPPDERMGSPLAFFAVASAAALAFLAGLGSLLETRLARAC